MFKKKLILFTTIIFTFYGSICAQEKLIINTSKSEIKWIGEYTFYFGGHDGTIDLKEGYLIKTGDKITGGAFVIDMNTIKNADLDSEEAKAGLVDHLKDPDFFDVKNHPDARLEITDVQYLTSTLMKVKANLTIKGITHPVELRAEANFEESTLATKFKIDRRLWEVNYTSKMRDGAISDAIGFIISLSL
ncbi:MAG: YceI family protein [Bacteroidota bacterium]